MPPMNFTPAATPSGDKSAPATKYSPSRTSPGMTGNTAPIPGAAKEGAPAPARKLGTAPTTPRAPAQDTGGGRDLASIIAGGDAANEEPVAAAGAEGQEAPADGAEGDQADPDLAWRLGVVAKKDREARARTAEAKAAEARVKEAETRLVQREQAAAQRERELEERVAKWRRDPKALLQDNGYVPETALQYMLNGEKLTPEQQSKLDFEERLAAERQDRDSALQQLRDEQAQKEREREEREQREDQEQASAREQEAIAQVSADIGEIITDDPKTFRLIAKAGDRGIRAVFAKVEELSNKAFEESGRRPQLTTRLLERAAAEIEQAARKEMQDQLADPDIAEAIGFSGRPAPRVQPKPTTLTNGLPRGNSPPAAEREETEGEKRERVKAELDRIFKRRAGQ